VRAVSLHRDLVVVTSRVFQTNAVLVRAPTQAGEPPGAESFLVDSPVLPDELELLPSLVQQAGFAAPSGLLATHADWDHLLGPLAFDVPLGCAQSSAERLRDEPGAAQRGLRDFDELLYVVRPRPLSLSAVQALPVPGRCGLAGPEGESDLELHPADGHTGDGMAIVVPWTRTLIAGDYLSGIEIPTFGPGGSLDAYAATLERLAPLAAAAEHVVPGHGPVLDAAGAGRVLAEDLAYLEDLRGRGEGARLPDGRRTREQRRLHAENVARLEG
jgi:glyoxylase-like metal-dependent hydrolase (beta-lactamase superfamily II)